MNQNSGIEQMLAEARALARNPAVCKSESGRLISNFCLRLAETLATGAPATGLMALHFHAEDLPGYGDNHLRRPPVHEDPIAALRVVLAALAKRGLRTWPMAIDHVDSMLFQAAQKYYSQTVGRAPRRRSVEGFEQHVLGRDDHVIDFGAAA